MKYISVKIIDACDVVRKRDQGNICALCDRMVDCERPQNNGCVGYSAMDDGQFIVNSNDIVIGVVV